jgi:hypothetical protein
MRKVSYDKFRTLIHAAQRLSECLELASEEENRFCVDICLRFEQLSLEMFRTASELKEIKDY